MFILFKHYRMALKCGTYMFCIKVFIIRKFWRQLISFIAVKGGHVEQF